jgi:hypothetical protein
MNWSVGSPSSVTRVDRPRQLHAHAVGRTPASTVQQGLRAVIRELKGDNLGGFEVLVLDPAPAPTGGST